MVEPEPELAIPVTSVVLFLVQVKVVFVKLFEVDKLTAVEV